MVKLRFRAIRIVVSTDNGEYGINLKIPDGLVVLRADNSAGKSTLVQSIIYVLGLEGMLSASRDVPLPHAMTDEIEDGNQKHKVLESTIHLEIENVHGVTVTVSRMAKTANSRNLVTVTYGPTITGTDGSATFEAEEMFVLDGGSATRKAGFHTWLTVFMGWDLPRVARFDGTDVPLYIQCMFPLMIVEQKKAWTGIQARMPVHYRIRDVAKRAVEFLLKFGVFEIVAKRQKLKQEAELIRSNWRKLSITVQTAARTANGIIQGIDEEPMEHLDALSPPTLQISKGERWLSASEAVDLDRAELSVLESKEIPTISMVANDLAAQLIQANEELATKQFAISDLFETVKSERAQLADLDVRISALEESDRSNKDILKLRKMGSSKLLKSSSDGHCPTCHQPVEDSLLPPDAIDRAMTLEDNISFIETQLALFKATRRSMAIAATANEAKLASLREAEAETRSKIRVLRESLNTQGNAPSVAAIQAHLQATERLKRTIEINSALQRHFEQFFALSRQWNAVSAALRELPKFDLSTDDIAKLKKLETLFREHAQQFGVTSLDPFSINISTESYRPEHSGFDLEFDISASDMIRTIWAYLHSLLELARSHDTNHLGILVLDEPRQQETAKPSFREFFQRAGSASKFGQQVIVATSEPEEELLKLLDSVPHIYLGFTGKILQRLG